MSKPFPHSRVPYDEPPERPMSMEFDTGLSYDKDLPLTIRVYSTGEAHLIADPMDHPIQVFDCTDAGMLRSASRLFDWLASVVEAQDEQEVQAPAQLMQQPAKPAASDTSKKPATAAKTEDASENQLKAWLNK